MCRVGAAGGGLAEGDGAGLRVVDGGGDCCEDGCGGGGVGAGGEDVDAGGGHAGEDFGGLGGGFAGGVDDLGQAGAQGAVVVDAGVAEVFEGEVARRAEACSGERAPRWTSARSSRRVVLFIIVMSVMWSVVRFCRRLPNLRAVRRAQDGAPGHVV